MVLRLKKKQNAPYFFAKYALFSRLSRYICYKTHYKQQSVIWNSRYDFVHAAIKCLHAKVEDLEFTATLNRMLPPNKGENIAQRAKHTSAEFTGPLRKQQASWLRCGRREVPITGCASFNKASYVGHSESHSSDNYSASWMSPYWLFFA